jgi:hypothetical protein
MATRANIVIDQGTTFDTSVSLTDENGDALDLSGYSANAQIRKWYSSTNSTAFSTALSTGTISLSLTSTQTSALEPGRYVYDIIIRSSSNSVTRVVEGIVTVTPRVTR